MAQFEREEDIKWDVFVEQTKRYVCSVLIIWFEYLIEALRNCMCL